MKYDDLCSSNTEFTYASLQQAKVKDSHDTCKHSETCKDIYVNKDTEQLPEYRNM